MSDQIIIRGARLHNLKNINLSIPKNKLVVLTGVSGSGKSSLGFDILLKEGQRQYMESLGMVTWGLAKPPVDSISGLSPTISVDQHLINRSPRSTVGTATEVYTYLRVLYARLGHRPCPNCGEDVPPITDYPEAEWEGEDGVDEDAEGMEATIPCPHCGARLPVLSMASFSFNKPAGACPTCTGLGVVHEPIVSRLVDEEKSLAQGAVSGWVSLQTDYYSRILRAAAAHYGFEFDLSLPVKAYNQVQRDLLLYGVESPLFQRHFPSAEPPVSVGRGRFEGIATSLLRRYGEHIHAHLHEEDYRDKLEDLLVTQVCPDCGGTRLRAESRAVTVQGETIVGVSRMSLSALGTWMVGLEAGFSHEEKLIAASILADLKERIHRLVEVGAGYLTLERSSPSLSAGESEKLRLATLLGSGLSGLLYVFDEPTIGMHQCDTQRLIEVLRRLRDLGNTVLVIEHDLETIAAADHVIDFGPRAGKHGGWVVAEGTPQEVARKPGSLTGDYLAGRKHIPMPKQRRTAGEKALIIRGARHNNLKNITVRLPLGLLVAVTGVSGSGKSSLVFDILDRALHVRQYGSGEKPGEHDGLEGAEHVDRVISIDQEPIGRLPRSNAATYTDTFSAIREAFAATPEARRLGLRARHFSFNVPADRDGTVGRCERCEGAGVLTVKMHFLPDVEVRCPVCHGRRFTRQTLSVRYRGYDIAQVLELTVEEALELFADFPAARKRLQVLFDVGLGYLQLGQSATTLSGGEAQRVKLAKELGHYMTGHTLYMLDEPTTGLHLADIERLLTVLRRLVEAGNTVVVIEHNLELVKTADWVIDLGPQAGEQGGEVVAEGTPEQVAQVVGSCTGEYLKKML